MFFKDWREDWCLLVNSNGEHVKTKVEWINGVPFAERFSELYALKANGTTSNRRYNWGPASGKKILKYRKKALEYPIDGMRMVR